MTQQTDEKTDLLLAVDGLATSAVATGEVTTLEHKVGDDTVELGVGVTEALLASAESAEVLGGVGDNVGAQLHGDAAEGGTVDGDIEVNYWKQPIKDKKREKKKRCWLTENHVLIVIPICTIAASILCMSSWLLKQQVVRPRENKLKHTLHSTTKSERVSRKRRRSVGNISEGAFSRFAVVIEVTMLSHRYIMSRIMPVRRLNLDELTSGKGHFDCVWDVCGDGEQKRRKKKKNITD